MPAFDILFGAFGAGVYFIVAVVHFDLWLRRRERRGHLWLALTSGSALIVDITGIAIPFAPPWTTKPLLGLNALGVAGATTCLLELVSAPNRAVTSARVRRFQAMVLLAAPSDLARASGATPRRPRSHHSQEGLQRARSLPSGHGTVGRHGPAIAPLPTRDQRALATLSYHPLRGGPSRREPLALATGTASAFDRGGCRARKEGAQKRLPTVG